MNDVLARIDEIEQRLRAISRSRLLFAGILTVLFLLLPLLWIDGDLWLHLLGALASLIAGTTGLLKVLQLWWQSSENGRSVMESDQVEKRDYEIAVLRRELHVCEEAIEAYQRSRWNWEQR